MVEKITDEPFDECWSEDARTRHERQHSPDEVRIHSHRHGASEVTKFILTLGAYNSFNRVFYRPNSRVYTTPEEVERCEVVDFESTDGTRLNGWLIRAKNSGHGTGTVVHFHGCCNNITHDLPFIQWLTGEGLNVFTFDYRGYGRSEGKPSREGIHQDCLAAVEHVRGRPDLDASRILVLGQSLGGALALATVGEGDRRGIRAVAVEGTFLSYRSVVNSKMSGSRITYPLASLLVSDAHSPRHSIKSISPIPLQIFHGVKDRVIPVELGRRVHAAAGEPKEFFEIEEGVHLDTFLAHGGAYRRRLADFFRRHVAR
jgi:fermentation-respiration switch protein FrsA (DUF1100 family)